MKQERSNIEIITNSIKGIKRSRNQDDILIIKTIDFYLLFLFDGVSSYQKSKEFISKCKNYISSNFSDYFANKICLDELLYDTHIHSLDCNIQGKSTCCALFIPFNEDYGYWASIGDSRIYSFSNYYIEQFTTDDNLPGNKNILTKCMGQDDLKRNDFSQTPIKINDNFLICSDGFYNLMEVNIKKYFSILNYIRGINIKKALERIQNNNNNDDSTYIIIRVNEF